MKNRKSGILFFICWMSSFADAGNNFTKQQDGEFIYNPFIRNGPFTHERTNFTSNSTRFSTTNGTGKSENIFETIFINNPVTGLISVVNTTSSRAGAWDPSSGLTSVFDGINGTAIIYNFRNQCGVYIPGRLLNRTWNSTIENWPNYFCNLSLSELLIQGRRNGTIFTVFNVTREIGDEVSNALSNWSPEFSRRFRNSSMDPLETLTNISITLSDLYNGTIKGFFSTIEARVVPINSLFRMLNFFRGLSNFYNSIRGGIRTLQSRNFLFDPVPVLRARNGIEALVFLLRALQFSYSLNELLNEYLNSAENFLRIVTMLGGNVCTGVTGFLRRMYEQMTGRYPSCGNSYENFLYDESLVNEWWESVNSLYYIARNLGSEFDGFRRFARLLREGRYNSAVVP